MYDGNGMFLSAGNVLGGAGGGAAGGRVGLLFIDFLAERPTRTPSPIWSPVVPKASLMLAAWVRVYGSGSS